MSALTFGTDDRQVEFFARYGVTNYEQAGQAIADAEVARREHYVINAGVRHDVPKTTFRAASDKSVEFMAALWLERSDKATAEQVIAWGKQQDQATISAKIDWLKTQPKLTTTTRTPIPDVPAGRYAVTGEQGQTVFLKVDRPTEGQYKGRTFVKVQAGSEYHPMALPVAKVLLAKILADTPKAAMLRYGKELERCGACGRELTDAESRNAMIGPKCRAKLGW